MSKDENSQSITKISDTNGNVENLKVDPITNRLLIEIEIVSEPISPVLNSAKIDENSENVALATDGTNIIPLHIDNRNGYLFVDLLEE
jgi:hypothetical protein